MGLIDEAPELPLLQIQGLLRVDLLDDREIRGRQTREGEPAASAADLYALAFGAERDAGLLRQ